MTVAAFAWIGAVGLAIIGFAFHAGCRSASTALSGTVLHASTAGDGFDDGFQRIVVGVVDCRSHPNAILQIGLDRGDLVEGQRIQVDLGSSGQVGLRLHPDSMSLSRPLLAYLGSAQLIVVGLLILTAPR